MRSMYDAVTPGNIPASAQLVAGYLNGPYAWSANDWARFPNAVHVGISVRGNFYDGHVLDVEVGDATPAEAVPWVQRRRQAGTDPSVYCNASTWPSVRQAFQQAGVAEPHYWIAKYDNDPTLPAGAVAKQHTNTAAWDLSSVADYWPGVDRIPVPKSDDDVIHCPPAVDDYVSIPCNGATALYIALGFNRSMRILGIAAVRDNTPGGPAYTSVQAGLDVVNFDQPGPIAIGPGCRVVQLRYSAPDHGFTAWCM
jgi:hypothetical protein